jgi:hypothetical protein
MGFNKTFLPTLQDLQKRFKDRPESTINWLKKSDAFLGPEESHEFVKWIFEVYLKWDGEGNPPEYTI